MKNTTITILGLILMTSLASALTSGDSVTYDLSDHFNSLNGSYLIEGNSSNLEGLNISINNTLIIISTELGYQPDSFNLTLFGEIKQEPQIGQGSGITTRGSSSIVLTPKNSNTPVIQNNITKPESPVNQSDIWTPNIQKETPKSKLNRNILILGVCGLVAGIIIVIYYGIKARRIE